MCFNMSVEDAKMLREALEPFSRSERRRRLSQRLSEFIEKKREITRQGFMRQVGEKVLLRVRALKWFREDRYPGIGWALRVIPALEIVWWDDTDVDFVYRFDGKELCKRVPVGISVDDLCQVLVEDDDEG